MSGNLATKFSYAALEPEVEQVARAAAIAIRSVTSSALPEIGRHLIAAKAALPHGAFTGWLEAELGLTPTSARNYMRAAAWLEGKSATVAALPPSIIYALASPKAATDLVDDVMEMAEAGTATPAAVRTRLAVAKMDATELRAAQRRSPNLTMSEMRKRREKQRADYRRQQEQEQRRQQAEDDARRARLRPLIEKLNLLDRDAVAELLVVMDDWRGRSVVRELLTSFAAPGDAA